MYYVSHQEHLMCIYIYIYIFFFLKNWRNDHKAYSYHNFQESKLVQNTVYHLWFNFIDIEP